MINTGPETVKIPNPSAALQYSTHFQLHEAERTSSTPKCGYKCILLPLLAPHHLLKYLCNKTNLNVKQVCTPPPAAAVEPPCPAPFFSKCPSVCLALAPSSSHTLSLLLLTLVETG